MPEALTGAFQTYWDDMERCRQAKAYWSLLHVAVCIPDICCALQSADGETRRKRYIKWCNRWLNNPRLNGAERYRMRCKLLHQGRASRDKRGRYAGFSFGQPSGDGVVDHMRPERRVLHLDVDELFKETKDGVERWIKSLEANPLGRKARDVEKHLKFLVKVKPIVIVTLGTGEIERIDTVIQTN
jgi:hypothetical protein